jgi:ATP-binding protein involved in chromosome partitioning
MTQPTRETILEALSALGLPDGGDVVSRDMVRALSPGWSGSAWR